MIPLDNLPLTLLFGARYRLLCDNLTRYEILFQLAGRVKQKKRVFLSSICSLSDNHKTTLIDNQDKKPPGNERTFLLWQTALAEEARNSVHQVDAPDFDESGPAALGAHSDSSLQADAWSSQ